MNNAKKSMLVCASLVITSAAFAGPQEGTWSFGLSGGGDFNLSGNLHGGATAPVASLAALNSNLPAIPAELRIGTRSYKSIYGSGFNINGEVAYGYSNDLEAFATLGYTRLSGGSVNVGSAFVPALNASLPVLGKFDPYKLFTLKVGGRYYLASGQKFRPFAGASIGLGTLSKINASFQVPVPGAAVTSHTPLPGSSSLNS